MSSRNLRQTRQSRYSSPATFGDKDGSNKSADTQVLKERQQSNLDKWVEPNPRIPIPSFEDTKGLERVGVLEHMAPLGVPPPAKMLQKLKFIGQQYQTSARATPIQSEEVATPVTEPELEPDKMQVASPIDVEMLSEPLQPPEEAIVATSPPRGRPAKREHDEMLQQANTTPSPIKASFAPSPFVPPRPTSIQEHLRQDRLQKHIERACNEAEENGENGIVLGLQQMRADAVQHPEIWNILEGVLQHTATDVQLRTFRRYIKHGIKQHRKSTDTAGSLQPLSVSPAPAISPRQAALFTQPFPTLSPTPAKPQTTQPPTSFTSPFRPRSSDNNFPLNSPTPQPAAVSPAISSPEMAPDQPLATVDRPSDSSPTRKRSDSVSSSSSLSSAKSMPEEFETPREPEQDNHIQEDQPVRLTGQRQVAKRVAAANQTRPLTTIHLITRPQSSDLPSTNKAAAKKLGFTKELLQYDPDEVLQRRKEFLEDSFHDYNTIPRPESNERSTFGVGKEVSPAPPYTATRPPSPMIHPYRITVQPALSSPASVQGALGLHINSTSRKRPYEEVDGDDLDTSSRLTLSPPPSLKGRLGAAIISRSGTPLGAKLPPPSKGRKSARVMVS